MKYNKYIKLILIIFLIISILFISFKLIKFYIPFLIAYIISIICEPIIKFIQNKFKLTRKTSSIISLIIVFSFLILILTSLIYKLTKETLNLSDKLNYYMELTINFFENNFNYIKFKIPNNLKIILEKESNKIIEEMTSKIKIILTNFITTITQIPIIIIYLIITILATYFITSDKLYLLDRLEYHLSKKWVGKVSIHIRQIINQLKNYVKAELILSFITFIIVLIGLNTLYLLGQNINYPILMSFIIAFIDALPILGAGIIMIPWSIILFITNIKSLSLWIFALYIIILITKQLIEPKIVSSKLGVHPLFTLISMYTCFKYIGVIGLILGPILLIILKNIFQDYIEKGLKNSFEDL